MVDVFTGSAGASAEQLGRTTFETLRAAAGAVEYKVVLDPAMGARKGALIHILERHESTPGVRFRQEDDPTRPPVPVRRNTRVMMLISFRLLCRVYPAS